MARAFQLIYLTSFLLMAGGVSFARSDSPPAATDSRTYVVMIDDAFDAYDAIITYTTNEVAIYPDVKKTTSLNALASETAYDLLSVTRYVPVVAEPERSDYGSRGIVRNKGPSAYTT